MKNNNDMTPVSWMTMMRVYLDLANDPTTAESVRTWVRMELMDLAAKLDHLFELPLTGPYETGTSSTPPKNWQQHNEYMAGPEPNPYDGTYSEE